MAIKLGEKLEGRISQGRRLPIAIAGTTHLPKREHGQGYLARARGGSEVSEEWQRDNGEKRDLISIVERL